MWDESCEAAFEALKKALITAPILSHPYCNIPFIVDTAASNTQLRAELSYIIKGAERPLVYGRRILSKTECQFATTKKEALAVVGTGNKMVQT